MCKILVLKGCPSTGKSTFAKQFVKDNDRYVRINKDDIRRMFGEYWLPKREYLVECVEYAIAEEIVMNGWNVVIDDTNLNPKYTEQWKQLATDNNCEIEFKEFYVPMEQAIEWDKNRENPVGETVIRKFYEKYYKNI